MGNAPSGAAAVVCPPFDLDALLTALAAKIAPLVADQLAQRLAPQAAPEPTTGLHDKQTAARAIGVSVATLDRFAREGAPVHVVGARRRFDVAELRAWVEARGKRAAMAPPKRQRNDVDISDVGGFHPTRASQ